ncbi:formate dehydrogenase [Bacillus sp. AFS076308]|uniref:formate dehydrogenase accessory protein FdhE n=1 Tax=unclassified Bacillus (in: firmicutes) TaxID=185979 RepID=UPI000BF4438E|nr:MULTISPECIES: formate dehydrogenase accessory protein FdhE [unclassified Bacillus (in: firmicutes)]PFO07899.1 formate dehydrogenase [Bacillus sp. AFS076308]PGV49524.1 formate dehydrogenase [Bacillus sp. AFS037270]
MIKSVVSNEYQELQKEIIKLQEQWKLQIEWRPFKINFDKAEAGAPIAELAEFELDMPRYKRWIMELIDLMIEFKPELELELSKIPSLLTEETLINWFGEAFFVDYTYFKRFAEEHEILESLPQFLAEVALRPFLQLIAEKAQPEVERMNISEYCPVCFEPVRLATLDEEGKKVIQCPRCHAHWHAKRLECSHCGNEDHTTIHFLSIEGESAMQIQVCEQCNGYIKIIDTKQFITKPSVALLDLLSIHLDIVAQDNGYSPVREKKVVH